MRMKAVFRPHEPMKMVKARFRPREPVYTTDVAPKDKVILISVRVTEKERAQLQAACDTLVEGIAGARLSKSKFMLQAALAHAQEIAASRRLKKG